MEKLRECPCCGGEGHVKSVSVPHSHGWVGCPECGLYIQWNRDPDGAIAKWNRRAGTAEREELPRGCFNCEYSWEGYQTLRCFGQKGAPSIRPSDCCEGWLLAGSREEQQ